MTTASIDIATLDKLFDNQKKLDDIFDSIFDDDSFSNCVMSDEPIIESRSSKKLYSEKDLMSYNGGNVLAQKKRNISYLILPVILEIVVIYYAMMNFT